MHLKDLKLLYPKQFDFHQGHSGENAVLLVDQIHERYFYDYIFIDLSKALDAVAHNNLLKKITQNERESVNLK